MKKIVIILACAVPLASAQGGARQSVAQQGIRNVCGPFRLNGQPAGGETIEIVANPPEAVDGPLFVRALPRFSRVPDELLILKSQKDSPPAYSLRNYECASYRIAFETYSGFSDAGTTVAATRIRDGAVADCPRAVDSLTGSGAIRGNGTAAVSHPTIFNELIAGSIPAESDPLSLNGPDGLVANNVVLHGDIHFTCLATIGEPCGGELEGAGDMRGTAKVYRRGEHLRDIEVVGHVDFAVAQIGSDASGDSIRISVKSGVVAVRADWRP